jgi:hypothetical protein
VKAEAIRRGLVPATESHRTHGLLHKEWSPEEADMWTSHDVVAALLSAACYVLVAVGVAGALLLRTWGFVALAASVLCAWGMFRVIDPKLRALSVAFDRNQAGYLERMDQRTRWEERS